MSAISNLCDFLCLLRFFILRYTLGCMLYLAIIPLIFFRLTFLRLEMSALTSPYWINMGAVAIAPQAGSTLLIEGCADVLEQEFCGFIVGFMVFSAALRTGGFRSRSGSRPGGIWWRVFRCAMTRSSAAGSSHWRCVSPPARA